MKLKIVGDSLKYPDVKVVNCDTGEMVEMVSKVEIIVDTEGNSKAVITFCDIVLDISIPIEDILFKHHIVQDVGT